VAAVSAASGSCLWEYGGVVGSLGRKSLGLIGPGEVAYSGGDVGGYSASKRVRKLRHAARDLACFGVFCTLVQCRAGQKQTVSTTELQPDPPAFIPPSSNSCLMRAGIDSSPLILRALPPAPRSRNWALPLIWYRRGFLFGPLWVGCIAVSWCWWGVNHPECASACFNPPPCMPHRRDP